MCVCVCVCVYLEFYLFTHLHILSWTQHQVGGDCLFVVEVKRVSVLLLAGVCCHGFMGHDHLSVHLSNIVWSVLVGRVLSPFKWDEAVMGRVMGLGFAVTQ